MEKDSLNIYRYAYRTDNNQTKSFIYNQEYFNDKKIDSSYKLWFFEDNILTKTIENYSLKLSNKYWSLLIYALLSIIFGLLLSNYIEKKLAKLAHWAKTHNAEKNLSKTLRDKTFSISSKTDKANHLEDRDSFFSETILSADAEIGMDSVDPGSIEESTKKLGGIIEAVYKNNHEIHEVYSHTTLEGNFWKTRTMLIYLVRTIQLASFVYDDTSKFRVFSWKTNKVNIKTVNQIKDIHSAFMPIYESVWDAKKIPFLYIKGRDSEGRLKETYFSLVDTISDLTYEKKWQKLDKNDNKETIKEIKKLIQEVKTKKKDIS
jgi:hypothetical protein